MFDVSVISDIRYSLLGASMTLTWASSDPGPFQIYVNGLKQWDGTDQKASIPIPPRNARVDIGAVSPGEQKADFSTDLPPVPKSRALLEWTGGTFQGSDIHGFRIFGEIEAGGGINYTGGYGIGGYGASGYGTAAPVLADLEAYAEGLVTDGYGIAPYGVGGYGLAPASYSWESPHYKTGTWSFAVVPYDTAGNLGEAAIVSVDLISAPEVVPEFSDRLRLHTSYAFADKALTITWQASTG